MTMVNKTRQRRSKAEMSHLRAVIWKIVAEHRPLTVRHLFYLMVAAGAIPKTEKAYKETVVKLAGEMREDWLARRAGRATIPFGRDYIVDAGRWVRKPRTYSGIEATLQETAAFYRRALWADQAVQITFFCEKDAIAEIVYQETSQWDVPLAVIRGDSSKTFLWDCAKAIEADAKPAIVYFLGDFDHKGRQIVESAVKRIRRYTDDGISIRYAILAVTEAQIAEYNLPTRPEKNEASTSRTAVEIDALPVEVLRDLIRGAIARHVDEEALRVTEAAEKSEREIMERIASNLPQVTKLVEELGSPT
jgi:hypothetical protein